MPHCVLKYSSFHVRVSGIIIGATRLPEGVIESGQTAQALSTDDKGVWTECGTTSSRPIDWIHSPQAEVPA